MRHLHGSANVSWSRLTLLSLLFFFICLGLGYPILNRIDWKKSPGGLSDVPVYAALVTANPIPDVNPHMRFRVLVPAMARPVYRLTRGRVGSWDPVMLALLVVNALFLSGTATLLVWLISRQTGSYNVGLGAALLFLLNFAVPNLRLVGLVDSSEGFFLLLLACLLWTRCFWALPIVAAVGACAKESFVPFLIAFTTAWWLSTLQVTRWTRGALTSGAWIAGAWTTGLTSLCLLQWKISHIFKTPWQFGLELHENSDYLAHFAHSFSDRNLWYIFFWLLPLSLFRLKHLARSWRIATAATVVAAFAMDAYYGGQPGTIGRALFSITGPLLSAAVALLLFQGGPSSEAAAATMTVRRRPMDRNILL